MRFFKFALLFFGVAFFIAPQFVLAGTCTEPDACNVGDLCNWPGSTQGTYCGKPSFYNRCKVNSSGKPICTALLNIVCDSTKSSVSQCGTVLVCISNKCVAPVTCEMKSLTDMQGTCESGQVCVISKCVDAKSPEAAETVKQYADLKKSSDAADARTAATRATLGLTASSTSSTYGSGNVTCGDRTFQCTKGGWFADVSNACYCCGSCTPDDLFVVANTFLRWLFGIIGALGLAMFVWGGFKWVTSAGDSGRVTEGRNAMKNVVIGLVIMFSAGAVVLLIQNKIGINSEVKISVTGGSTGSSSSSSTTQTPAATKDTVTYGNLAMGSSCNVQQDTKSSDCSEGMNCYGIKDNPNLKGVCLAINPKGSSKAGEDCWLLNNGEGDTCAVGTCKVDSGDTTPGTRGKCWTQEEINQFMDNTICSGDSQCAKGFKCVSSRCVISESSNAGRGEVCRVLPGSSTNDCTSTFKCFTDLNNLSAPRKVGDSGKCAYNQSLAEWKDCLGNVECKTGYLCKSVPKLSDKNYCVSKSRTFNVEAGKSCVKFTVGGVLVDNCAAPLECYYGKTTDKSGLCMPPNPVNSVGKNQECYLLPGSAKMCTGDLKCVSYVSGSYKTTAGSKGLCFPPDGTIDENQQCFYLPGRNMCKTNLVCDVGFLPKTFGNPGICKKK